MVSQQDTHVLLSDVRLPGVRLKDRVRNASFVDARAAPEDSFVEGIKGACLEKGSSPCHVIHS